MNPNHITLPIFPHKTHCLQLLINTDLTESALESASFMSRTVWGWI